MLPDGLGLFFKKIAPNISTPQKYEKNKSIKHSNLFSISPPPYLLMAFISSFETLALNDLEL